MLLTVKKCWEKLRIAEQSLEKLSWFKKSWVRSKEKVDQSSVD